MLEKLRWWVLLLRPLEWLSAALIYALGVGIADYLGFTINWSFYWLGQAWVSLLQISAYALDAYFEALKTSTGLPGPQDNPLGPGKLPPEAALGVAGAGMVVCASLSLPILTSPQFSPLIGMLMLSLLAAALLYALPPLRLAAAGYQEFLDTLMIVILPPALAIVLQTGELNRLLAMTCFPLAALFMAQRLAWALPAYGTDLRYERKTLLMLMGWERGMLLHDLLILTAFGLVVAAFFFGLPFGLGAPALLGMPLGALQIWQMRQIAEGAKPNWNALRFNAVALFAVTAYILTFFFWTR